MALAGNFSNGAGRWQRLALLSLVLVIILSVLVPTIVSAEDPVSRISSPQSGASVMGVVVISGTATHPSFKFYKIEIAAEPGSNWTVIGDMHSNQVKDGVLAQWDTRSVPDGSYSLRLLVVDETGNYLESVVRQIVVNNSGPTPTPTPQLTATAIAQLTATVMTATGTPGTITPSGTPQATATVQIVVPALTTTVMPLKTTSPVVLQTAVATGTAVNTSGGTGNAITDAVGKIFKDMLGSLGIDFSGLGSAFWRGAALALGVFLAVGVLALLRAIIIGLYRLIRR